MTVFQQTVEAVKTAYPKFSPACLSLASRTYETGVMMTPRAQMLADSVERATRPYRRRCDKRVKSISFRCRLSPAAAQIVKHQMEAEGITQQDLIERLLLEWATKNRSPVCKTEERQGDEADERPDFASENTTNDVGGQR